MTKQPRRTSALQLILHTEPHPNQLIHLSNNVLITHNLGHKLSLILEEDNIKIDQMINLITQNLSVKSEALKKLTNIRSAENN